MTDSTTRPNGCRRLIASGRDSDIFEYGAHSVLRRSRHGRSMIAEAQTMEHVRRWGYPVPAVESYPHNGTTMIMEYVEGPTLLQQLGRKPWTVRRQGAALASLHARLHEIPAPDFLSGAPTGHGNELLHLDLHPLNVILGPRGPVVIDWPNAARGNGAVDVAVTWILLEAGQIPKSGILGALMEQFRASFVRSFLNQSDAATARTHLAAVAEWKAQDPNMSPSEVQKMRRVGDEDGVKR